jgi:hypothetical protein
VSVCRDDLVASMPTPECGEAMDPYCACITSSVPLLSSIPYTHVEEEAEEEEAEVLMRSLPPVTLLQRKERDSALVRMDVGLSLVHAACRKAST